MIKIDVDTRCWQIPKEECFLGVESDDKVKILQFELSKNEFCDGLNFTECNCYINYKNEGNDTIPYGITDMALQEDGTVTFTWKVSRGATIFKGNTFAILCAKKVRDDGTITNEWNSRIGSFTVAKGIEPSSSITEVPEIDIISQLLLNAQNNIEQSNSLLEKAEGLGYLKEDFDVLEARMNQFTSLQEGSTTGDAELQDIRVGVDGKTYDNAGDAVRGQIGELKGDLVQLQKNQPITLNLEWELGSVNSDGTDGGNTFWIRTKWKTDFDGLRTNISVDDGFQYALITYHSDGSATRTAFRTEPLEVECEIGEMCRIMVSKVAYETSTLDFANHVHINSTAKITEEVTNAIALAKNAIEDVSELSENHTNLFDYTKATMDKAVLKDNGTLMDIDGWLVSDYIPVSKNETLFLSIDGVKTNFSTLALYDLNKSYVSGLGGTVDTVSYTPTVDGYIRFSKSNQMNYEKIKLEKNGVTKFTEYDEPYVLVTKQSLPEDLGQSKIYEGKNILTLGDSITAMGGNQGWTNWLKSYVNANKLVNVSVAGATWKDKVEDQIYDGNPQPSTDGNCIGNQVQKVINSKNNGESDYQDFDIIIIAAGTNDPYDSTSETIDTVESQFVSDYSQGNYAVVPLANVNRRTFAGIMRYTYQKLHELYPNADFFICTPIQECYENFVYIKNKGDYLNYIADRLSINTINVRRCGILNIHESQTSTIDYDNPSYEESSNKEDLIDGIHTDVTGAKKMARYIARDIINFYAIN